MMMNSSSLSLDRLSDQVGSCDYCRKMHASCVGRPACTNCITKGIECKFTPKKKPGPAPGFKRLPSTTSASPPPSTASIKKKKHKSDCKSEDSTKKICTKKKKTTTTSTDLVTYQGGNEAIVNPLSSSLERMFQPYVDYIQTYKRLFAPKFRPLFAGIQEIPSLEFLLPLSSSSLEGKINQMYLLAILGVGALFSSRKDDANLFAHTAFQSFKDFLDQGKDYIQSSADKTSLNVSLTTLTNFFSLVEAHDKMPYTALLSYELTCKDVANFKKTRNVTLKQVQTMAQAFLSNLILMNKEEKEQTFNLLMACSYNFPSIHCWTMYIRVLCDLFEAIEGAICDVTPNLHVIGKGEDYLLHLQAQGEHHNLVEEYGAVFSGLKAALSWVAGFYHSAQSQAEAVTPKLIRLINTSEEISIAAVMTGALCAKINLIAGKIGLLNQMKDAFRTKEPFIPFITKLWSGLDENAPDSGAYPWFPEFLLVTNSLKAVKHRLMLEYSNVSTMKEDALESKVLTTIKSCASQLNSPSPSSASTPATSPSPPPALHPTYQLSTPIAPVYNHPSYNPNPPIFYSPLNHNVTPELNDSYLENLTENLYSTSEDIQQYSLVENLDSPAQLQPGPGPQQYLSHLNYG